MLGNIGDLGLEPKFVINSANICWFLRVNFTYHFKHVRGFKFPPAVGCRWAQFHTLDPWPCDLAVSSSPVLGFGQGSCFGQWDAHRHGINRGLRRPSVLGFLSLESCLLLWEGPAGVKDHGSRAESFLLSQSKSSWLPSHQMTSR